MRPHAAGSAGAQRNAAPPTPHARTIDLVHVAHDVERGARRGRRAVAAGPRRRRRARRRHRHTPAVHLALLWELLLVYVGNLHCVQGGPGERAGAVSAGAADCGDGRAVGGGSHEPARQQQQQRQCTPGCRRAAAAAAQDARLSLEMVLLAGSSTSRLVPSVVRTNTRCFSPLAAAACAGPAAFLGGMMVVPQLRRGAVRPLRTWLLSVLFRAKGWL